MQSMAALAPASLTTAAAQEVGEAGGRGRILLAVFDVLDGAGIRYCVLHGYEGYPRRIGSDVDCVVDGAVSRAELVRLLARNSARTGAEVLRCKGSHIVLGGRDADGSLSFLTLDVSADCELDGVRFYDGGEVLEGRRRHGGFWIPAPHLEFGWRLAGSLAKGRLDDERLAKLARLYRQDADGCEREVARLWGRRHADMIVGAVRSGEWDPVRGSLGDLQAELRRRAILRRPGRFTANRLRDVLDRMRRVWRPDGVYLVVLGPDGAGKSSVIDALELGLAGLFPRLACYGFTPAVIHRLRHGAYRENSAPHALPPRSWIQSVARALGYWLVYYTTGYLVRRLELARSALVLCDRHYVDVLVDPARYRYGGPMGLARLIWRIIPKPDLVVLLDAPAEVLQARKREVPFEETARQREAYLSLVRSLPYGRVVDAGQPRERVALDASEIVLRLLRTRIARRFGVEQDAG